MALGTTRGGKRRFALRLYPQFGLYFWRGRRYALRMGRFAEREFYHVYNRGVEKRQIFLDKADYLRFTNCLLLFNSSAQIEIRKARKSELAESGPPRKPKNEPLASIVSYVLMKNHVHLLIFCRKKENLSVLLQKIFGGYTMYFNTKYQRSGVLFQGRSKSKHVAKDNYLRHLIYYIHLNPLDYFRPEWREQEIKNAEEAKNFLTNYEWSSLAGVSRKKFDPILDYNILSELLPEKQDIESEISDWSASFYAKNKDYFLDA